MKHTRITSEQIAKELAAVETEIAQRRQKLRVLEARRETLKTVQSAILKFQGKTPHSSQPSCIKAETRKDSGGARYFHSEGLTSALVRFLYGKSNGSFVIEAATRTGIPAKNTRTAFVRLCKNGLMSRSGKEYALTQKGIAAWEESPLFGWEPGR